MFENICIANDESLEIFWEAIPNACAKKAESMTSNSGQIGQNQLTQVERT